MSTHQSNQPHEPSQAKSTHRARNLAVVMVLAGGIALIFYAHGAWWWYAPLAMVGVVLAHIAILGGIAFVGARVTRGRRAHSGPTYSHQTADHSDQAESTLLHKPRQYDLLERLHALGRERKLRQ